VTKPQQMTKRLGSRNSSQRWAADAAAGPAERLRSTASRVLLAGALTSTLVLGATLVAVDRLQSSGTNSVGRPDQTATDEQTKAEVVEQTKVIVAVAGLQNPRAGFLFMSCENRDDPPYQGAVYLNFTIPADGGVEAYFRGVAAALVARGWKEGLPPNQHLLGKTLSKDGIVATLYPDSDFPQQAAGRIYGHCRDMNNHRGDSTAWVDITDQLH
jgi:hypothetical protein